MIVVAYTVSVVLALFVGYRQGRRQAHNQASIQGFHAGLAAGLRYCQTGAKTVEVNLDQATVKVTFTEVEHA